MIKWTDMSLNSSSLYQPFLLVAEIARCHHSPFMFSSSQAISGNWVPEKMKETPELLKNSSKS